MSPAAASKATDLTEAPEAKEKFAKSYTAAGLGLVSWHSVTVRPCVGATPGAANKNPKPEEHQQHISAKEFDL